MSSEVLPIRDPYYLETVVFQVENTLFKVPRFQFERHSGIFATMLSSLSQDVEGAKGSSDETPFELDGIKYVDFRRLLGVLYPMTAIPKTPTLSKDEWISVLKLANLWDFIEVRNLAIEQLTLYAGSLDCIERILFAREFDVSAWLRSGYVELARRKAIISREEGGRIGWDVALQISRLRTAKKSNSDENPYEKVDLGDLFRAELKRADAAQTPAVASRHMNAKAATHTAPVTFGATTPLVPRSGHSDYRSGTLDNPETSAFGRFSGPSSLPFGFSGFAPSHYGHIRDCR